MYAFVNKGYYVRESRLICGSLLSKPIQNQNFVCAPQLLSLWFGERADQFSEVHGTTQMTR
jgi:hypothetical protein